MTTFEVKIPAGQTVNVAQYVNMSGTLNILIRTRDGSNHLPACWWIAWGFGSVSQLGEHKDHFTTDIPVSWWRGVVHAKLRASADDTDTVLTIGENGELDFSKSFTWP